MAQALMSPPNPSIGWYGISNGALVNDNSVGTLPNEPALKSCAFGKKSPFSRGLVFMSGQRQKLNWRGIALAFFCPWLLFCFVYYILAFNIRYAFPKVSFLLVVLAFVVGVVPALYWGFRAMTGKFTEQCYIPTWWVFLAITMLLAFVLGVVLAEWNYENHLEPYYNLQNLEEYRDIDTTQYLGLQLQDAGKISFASGTVLDLGHSMGFKNHDVYCVSPIRTAGGTTAASVDFWAVGKNCCSGVQADFHCSGFSDPKATGALRLMNNADRPFYRLAVQQAEATYKMVASHPLFFRWVHDADEEVDKFFRRGLYYYAVGVATYFIFQAFLTLSATLAFSKLIHLQ